MPFICVMLILLISLSLTISELQEGLTAAGLGPGVTDGPRMPPRERRGQGWPSVGLTLPPVAVCALGR